MTNGICRNHSISRITGFIRNKDVRFCASNRFRRGPHHLRQMTNRLVLPPRYHRVVFVEVKVFRVPAIDAFVARAALRAEIPRDVFADSFSSVFAVLVRMWPVSSRLEARGEFQRMSRSSFCKVVSPLLSGLLQARIPKKRSLNYNLFSRNYFLTIMKRN